MAGVLYLASAVALGGIFTAYGVWMLASDDERAPVAAFRYSIWYLALLFAVLLADHYLAI
jgi:protoheme IX farnesyltransferase